MTPSECKFCGLHGVWHIDDDTVFACGTIWAGRVDVWNQSTGCVEIMSLRDRIRRALEKLKAAKRYRVLPVSRTHVEYDRTPDGPVTDSETLDVLARILEGDADEQ